jgi:hypothetical protein
MQQRIGGQEKSAGAWRKESLARYLDQRSALDR